MGLMVHSVTCDQVSSSQATLSESICLGIISTYAQERPGLSQHGKGIALASWIKGLSLVKNGSVSAMRRMCLTALCIRPCGPFKEEEEFKCEENIG